MTTDHPRPAIGTVYAGLALTVAVTAVPDVDQTVLADHIRAGYPAYTEARIDGAATTYLIYLSTVAALGVATWLGTNWAVKAGKRWARGGAAAMFALATSIALFDLLVKDTSGDTGLPPVLGWVGLLPSLAGLVAVTLLFTKGGAG
jgi:hypothetical protein